MGKSTPATRARANMQKRNNIIAQQGIRWRVSVRVGNPELGLQQPPLMTEYFDDEVLKNSFIDTMLKGRESYVLVTEEAIKVYEANKP